MIHELTGNLLRKVYNDIAFTEKTEKKFLPNINISPSDNLRLGLSNI